MAKRTPTEQKSAEDTVKKVISGVTSYFNATKRIREERLEDFNFNFGGEYQWDPKDRERLRSQGRPAQTFNLVGPVVNFVAGYQQDREQDFRAYPRGAQDEQLGRIMTSLMRYQMDMCGGMSILHQGFRKGLIGGQSVFEVAQSYEYTDDLAEGDTAINVLEHDTWGHEPGARRYDRNDSVYQFKLIWMPVDDAKRKWPQHAASLMRGIQHDWLHEDPTTTGVPLQMMEQFVDFEQDRVRILQYWYRVPVEVALLVNTQSGDVQRFGSQKDAESALRNIYDTAGAMAAQQYELQTATSQTALIHKATGAMRTYIKPEQASDVLDTIRRQAGSQAAEAYEMIIRPTTALRVSNVTAWEMLDDNPSPRGADWRFPFVPFTVYQDTDDLNQIKGIIRDIKDPQREVNWHHSTMLDTLMRGPKGGVWVNKAENVDVESLRSEYSKAGFIGEYVGQPPIPVTPQIVSNSDMAMLQFGIDSIMRISGINAEMMGQTTQKTVSGRAIQSRQDGGLVGIGTIFLNWSTTKTLIGELLVRAIQQYYSPEKMDRVIGAEQRRLAAIGMSVPNELPPDVLYAQYKTLKQIDMKIVVSFQDSSPTARSAVFAQMMQLKAAGAPIPLQLIVEASDMPYKQEIITALARQGEQPANPQLAQVISAGQGQGGPTGVNTTT